MLKLVSDFRMNPSQNICGRCQAPFMKYALEEERSFAYEPNQNLVWCCTEGHVLEQVKCPGHGQPLVLRKASTAKFKGEYYSCYVPFSDANSCGKRKILDREKKSIWYSKQDVMEAYVRVRDASQSSRQSSISSASYQSSRLNMTDRFSDMASSLGVSNMDRYGPYYRNEQPLRDVNRDRNQNQVAIYQPQSSAVNNRRNNNQSHRGNGNQNNYRGNQNRNGSQTSRFASQTSRNTSHNNQSTNQNRNSNQGRHSNQSQNNRGQMSRGRGRGRGGNRGNGRPVIQHITIEGNANITTQTGQRNWSNY